MVDISRSNALVGVFLLGGALLGVALGFASLDYKDSGTNKVTADDLIVTLESDEQGEQTGVVKIENTANKKVFAYGKGEDRLIYANSTISYNSRDIPILDIYNREGEALYEIIYDPELGAVTIERKPDSPVIS